MTLSVEALLVVSLLMAVFAAVATIGTSLFLGAGFERLRTGFENIKKQTAFFSDAIYRLDGRVAGIEKQGEYFFEAIHNLEQERTAFPQAGPVEPAKETAINKEPEESLIKASRDDVMLAGTDKLLTDQGFTAGGLWTAEAIPQSKYLH